MNRLLTLAAILLLATPLTAIGAEGLVILESPLPPKDTLDRVEANAEQRGLKIFARIDHAAGAAKVGKSLPPTELLIFGNPKGGTPFIECAQTVAIDLPLKILVWEDADGKVWLGYNDPAFIADRHGVPECPSVAKLSKALAGLAEASTAP
ncbi:MAG: DUF302 domain-containing protein [Thiohalocapsa sp.]